MRGPMQKPLGTTERQNGEAMRLEKRATELQADGTRTQSRCGLRSSQIEGTEDDAKSILQKVVYDHENVLDAIKSQKSKEVQS